MSLRLTMALVEAVGAMHPPEQPESPASGSHPSRGSSTQQRSPEHALLSAPPQTSTARRRPGGFAWQKQFGLSASIGRLVPRALRRMPVPSSVGRPTSKVHASPHAAGMRAADSHPVRTQYGDAGAT